MKHTRAVLFSCSMVIGVFFFSSDVSAAGVYTDRINSSPLKSAAQDMVISGNYAYVIEGNSSDLAAGYIDVFDLSDPAHPVKKALVSNTDFSGGPWGVFWASISISGNRMYATWTNMSKTLVSAYDISDPASPALLGNFNTGKPFSMSTAVHGSYLYIATLSGLNIVNISDPANMSLANNIVNAGYYTVRISGDYLYTSTYVAGDSSIGGRLAIYSLSDPVHPASVGSASAARSITGIDISGNYAYVGRAAGGNEFEIFDMTNKAAPVKVGGNQYATNLNLHRLAADGDYAYAPYDGGVYNVFDISDPTAPAIAGTANVSGYGIRAIPYAGNYVIIASGWGGGGGGGYLNVFTEIHTPIDGACGSTNNACLSGSLSDTADTPNALYNWDCNGLYGGSSVSCQACMTWLWSPNPATMCPGASFTQTSNCGETQTTIGTGPGVWFPDAADTCPSSTVIQSRCGDQRIVSGTKSCPTSDWHEVAPTN